MVEWTVARTSLNSKIRDKSLNLFGVVVISAAFYAAWLELTFFET